MNSERLSYLALGVDVANVGSDTCRASFSKRSMLNGCQRRPKHTWSKADIVEGKLANPGVQLEQQRQWLANATSGTENSDLGVL